RDERRAGLIGPMTTTLVTGAAGFAGSHVLDQLASDAPASSVSGRIVAWHRPRATAAVLRHRETVEWQAIDILDREAVRSAIAKIRPSIVYHCAGAAHVGRA